MSNGVDSNARTLRRELEWLERVMLASIDAHFHARGDAAALRPALAPPDLLGDASPYAQLVAECGFGADERVVLALALAPHVKPQLLDILRVRNKNLDRGFTEFGGWNGKSHGGFLPTGETAMFILAGEDLARRFECQALFEEGHAFQRLGIVHLDHESAGEPQFSGALLLGDEYVQRLTTGALHKPDFTGSFPAKRITTPLEWGDLVLADEVMQQVESINTWIGHSDTLMNTWGLARSIKPGYRALFYGPPGTGKTLTATLVGKAAGIDVYRIDLSMVVSKYIGETEKNLARVFDQAKERRWILFFDEADSLFGKRTATSSSNDRYANQEVSYLLQRVEDFPGTVILATNLKANIDDAFARRFQSMVYFPMPEPEQRLKLWQHMLAGVPAADDPALLADLASTYELSGGAIGNVIRYAAIQALQEGAARVASEHLRAGVIKEMRKEGRTA